MKFKLTALFLLPAVFTLSSYAQNISVKSFRALQNDMDARVNYPKIDQNGDKCALIKVKTTQTGFVFEGDMMGIEKTEQKVAEIWLYVPHGAKKLSIAHQQLGRLDNYIYTEAIKEATVYEMVLTTANITTIVEDYEAPMQWLIVTSEPEGADVFINEQYVGVTPYQAKMEIGIYNYRIEKSMYYNEAGKFELIEEERTNLTSTLKPNFGYVKINTLPEQGASVEIDDKETNGITPFTSQKLTSGEHTLTLKKVMFNPKTIDFTITDGQTTNLNIDLEPNFAEVTVTTNPEADIYIDEIKKGYGTITERLNPGLHTFEAKKDKFYGDKTQEEFTIGQKKEVSLHLNAKTGSIDIITSPFDAKIKLNGKEYGTSPNTIKDLLVGDYTLTLEKETYGSINKTITITENQTTSINETLPSGKKVTINSQPQGASLSINGVNHGNTPQTLTLGFGDHDIKLVKGKKVVQETISLTQSGKTKWQFNVNEDEGIIVDGMLIDTRNNEKYKIVIIGKQTWMAENLNYKTNNTYCYDNNESNCKKYGRLYTWEVAKKACPSGWHLPTDNEWKQLEKHLGMNQTDADKRGWRIRNEGKKLKAASGWEKERNGTDNYGFSALPGGYRVNDGSYGLIGYVGSWWSATEYGTYDAWIRRLDSHSNNVLRYNLSKTDSYSVRCLRD